MTNRAFDVLAPGTARAIICYDKLHELQQDQDCKDEAKRDNKIHMSPQLHSIEEDTGEMKLTAIKYHYIETHHLCNSFCQKGQITKVSSDITQ